MSDELKNALEMTGCKDEADLIDMANVGTSLMNAIDTFTTGDDSIIKNWSPADDPTEIVGDLYNMLDESLACHRQAMGEVKELQAALDSQNPTPVSNVAGNPIAWEYELGVGREGYAGIVRWERRVTFNHPSEWTEAAIRNVKALGYQDSPPSHLSGSLEEKRACIAKAEAAFSNWWGTKLNKSEALHWPMREAFLAGYSEFKRLHFDNPPPAPNPWGHVPCPCTTFEQAEDCPVGFPSLLCAACSGTGNATQDTVVALAAEMLKVAEQLDELEDPFAAWESIELLKSQSTPSSNLEGETTTSFRIEWIAAARPPAHQNPMNGKAWMDSFDAAVRHMKSQASDATFVSLKEVVTTIVQSDRSADLRAALATATDGN